MVRSPMLPDPHSRSRLRFAPVTTDPIRARWAAGEPAFAAWLLFESPASAEILATAGFEAIVMDLQHGSTTLSDLPHLLRALEPTPAVPFVRASWNDPAELMRALDLGARGVICPMVGSRTEAEAFVSACRYPPAGSRSYGPIQGALGRGHDQTTRANEELLLFAMIETSDGFANLDEIAATPGLDGLFVGPADLSLAIGLETFADLSDPTLLAPLDAIVDVSNSHGITPGIHAPSPTSAAEMVARGFRLVSCAIDAELLRDAAEAALRATRPPG
jgi:4-hydroxy-2-oxoheptanedioate aldolase